MMPINIVFPEGDGLRAAAGTKVYNEDGTEITDIQRIVIDVTEDSILTATITVALGEVEGSIAFEGKLVPEDCEAPSGL